MATNRAVALQIAWRFLKGSQSRLLRGTAIASVGSTGLGCASIVVALSLMNGYTNELIDKMSRSGALIVAPLDAREDLSELAREVLAVPGVVDAVPAAVVPCVVSAGGRSGSGIDATLRGVDPGQGVWTGTAEELAVRGGVPGAVVGIELARRLGLNAGDLLRVVAIDLADSRRLPRFRYKTVRFVSTFDIGFSVFDESYLLVDRRVVESLVAASHYLEVRVADPGRPGVVRARLERRLGEGYLVRDWRDSSPGLFTALRLQKWMLFLVLGLIVVVSTFNVVATLVVLVRERTREIGLLSALGLRPAVLRSVFLWSGGILGLVGALGGIAAGVVLTAALSASGLLRFDREVAEVYFIDRVPLVVETGDLLVVAGFAVVVALIASFVPAARASRIEPAAALRYE